MSIDLQTRVEYVLLNFPETRDSDLKLFIKVINRFYWCDITWSQVEKMLNAPSYASIIRIRSKFQNTKKQYQPSPKVKKMRHQTQADYRSRYSPLYKEDL